MSKHIITVLVTVVTIFYSCKKDTTDTTADNALYNEIITAGYTYYQGGNTLPGVSPSPHGSFKLRFNPIAATALDVNGELPADSSFPVGSIIIKEIFSGGSISLLAVMKKDPLNGNAGSGWVWAEFYTDGSAAFSTGKKGNGCINCHSSLPNRDLTKTFDLH